MMTTWDEELIAAYADGELHVLVEHRFEEALASDASLRAQVEAQRRLKARLGGHFDPVLDEPVPARLAALLRPEAGARVVPIGAARRRRFPRRAWVPAAMAASLAAGWFGGQLIGEGPGVAALPVARGELAAALDTRLAAAPFPGEGPRIGVTFRNVQGQVCRTFDGAVAGFACREGQAWRLRMLTEGSGPAGGDYRQAASGPALVMQAAQDAAAGDPVGPDEERRLAEAGWR